MDTQIAPHAFFEAIVSSSDDAIIGKTLDGIVLSWNGAAERMFGRTAAEMVGQPMLTVFPPDRFDEERMILASIARGETVAHFETVRLRRDGTPFHVSATISPIRDATGRIVGASKIARDVSAQIAEQSRLGELVRVARVYESLVESSDDAIVTKTVDGIVTSWNPGAERIFGWRAHEIIGRPFTLVIPPDRLDEEVRILAQISAGHKVNHFETVRVRRDGTMINVSASISPLHDDKGRIVGACKIARDITQRIAAERTIWRQANFDTLTLLPNRRHFQECLRRELMRAKRLGHGAAVLFIDLDHFKEVNDALGHAAGDQLLTQAAARIKGALREVDTVARMGGDEFTALLPDIERDEETTAIALRVNQRLFEPFVLDDDVPVHISGSIGVALFPSDGQSADELLRCADQAMYQSKREGRNRSCTFVQVDEDAKRGRLQLFADLRHAVARDELRLLYQPVVDLHTGDVRKVEALIRWQSPTHGTVSPAAFIPLAEETGLIGEIGDWVFDTVVRQTVQWRRRHGDTLHVGLNLSPVQLRAGPDHFRRWVDLLARTGLPGSALVLEITESMIVGASDAVGAAIELLREADLQLAIDDFGTGYSNLAYLSRLDVQFLKIDRSFTQRITDGPRDLALCEAIVAMAHKIDLEVIAEGIETDAQATLLRRIGCDLGQGYWFSTPKPADEIESFFTSLT